MQIQLKIAKAMYHLFTTGNQISPQSNPIIYNSLQSSQQPKPESNWYLNLRDILHILSQANAYVSEQEEWGFDLARIYIFVAVEQGGGRGFVSGMG